MDMFQDDGFEMMAATVEPTQLPVTQTPVTDTQLPTPATTQAMEIDMVCLLRKPRQVMYAECLQPHPSAGPSRKRPARRTQPDTQSSYNMFGDPYDMEPPQTATDNPEIRELYEQTRASNPVRSQKNQASLESAQADGESQNSTLGSSSLPRPSVVPETMDLDRDDEEDIIQVTLKRGAKARLQDRTASAVLMPPPAQVPTRRGRSPTEEADLDTRPKTKSKSNNPPPPSPKKKAAAEQEKEKEIPTGELDKDEAFLQAITKAKNSKKQIDNLDKEFNQLRIPKPNGAAGSKVVRSREEDIPDWGLVNDFGDELRGNFIQIVRKDLFRKDQPRAVERVDDGRPNFKKFKKVGVILG